MFASVNVNALDFIAMGINTHPSPAEAGKRLDYEVIVNAGHASPCHGSLRLDLPSGVTFLHSAPHGSYFSSQDAVEWPNQRYHNNTLYYHAYVDVPAGFTGDLSASAVISGGCSASSGTVITPVDPGAAPILDISKTASKTSANAGEQIVYTLKYENTGKATATNVVITDTLPAGVTFNAASAPGTHAAGTVTWNLPSVTAGTTGSVTTTVTVNSPITNGTTLTNNASIKSTETSLVNGKPVDVTATSAPDLLISKRAPSHVNAGEQFTYSIDYGNTGSDTATGVTIEETLPAGLSFVSADNGGVENAGTIVWSVPDLRAGLAHGVSAVVEVLAPQTNGTVITNDQLFIESSETGSIQTFKKTDVTVDSRPILTLDKTASKTTAKAGETLTYTLSYANVGSDVATGIKLLDTLPVDVTFISATGGGTLSTANGVNEIEWNFGSLAAGASGAVTVRASINTPIADGTVLHNSAVISSVEVTQAVTAIANTTVSSAPQLQISKSVSKSQALDGDSLVYTITYSNTGTDVATGVSIQDHLSSDVTFVQASGGGAYTGGVVLWNLGDINPGTTNSVTITATVNPLVPSGSVLHNATTIDGTNTNPVSAAVAPADVTIIGQPSFHLDLQAPPTAVPGDTLVYTFSYENVGTTVATNTRLTSVLPPGVTFSSASGSGSLSSNVITWDLGSVGVRQSGSVTATVTVNSPQTDGTRLTNTASIMDMGGHGFPGSVTTTINSSPVLILTKSASKTVARPGDTIIYTLDYANTGTDQATNVLLEDHLPPEVTFKSAVGGGTESGGIVGWPLGTLAAGASGSVNVTVTVNSPISNGTILHNDATVDSAQTAPVAAQRVDIPVNSAPVLSISKTASRPTASPGDTIVYTISYSNSGTDEATNVLIEDHLPTDVTFVSATENGADNGGIVDWNIGTMAAGTSGSVSVTVTVNTPLANGIKLHNTASIDSNETSHISSPVVDVTVTSAPVLNTLTKTVSKTTASPGQTLVYTINYSNTGTTDATNVVLEDHLPPNVLFQSASTPGTESAGVVTWNIGTVGAGASGSATITVVVASPLANGTSLNNYATITSTETTPFSAQSKPVTITSAPVLTLTKTASAPVVNAGGQLTYTLSYGNTGSDTATGIALQDPLPPEVSFVSATSGGTVNAGTVNWSLPDLPAGSSGSVIVTVAVASPLANGTVLHNSANIDSAETPPLASALVDVTVSSAPALLITKAASSPNVTAGGQISYTLSYENLGSDQANNVTIVDHLPPELTFNSASAGGSNNAGVVTWNIPTLAAGASGSVTLSATAKTPLADGTVLPNTSSISATGVLPVVAPLVPVTVLSSPEFTLTKTPSASPVSAGKQISFDLQYVNIGTDVATGVQIVDQIPPNTTFVSASGGVMPDSSGLITWNIGSVSAQSGGSVSLTLAANSPLPDGTVITNQASITSNETPPLSAIGSFVVSSAPQLMISKTAASTVVQAGGQVLYSVQLANTGSDAATGVTIVDTIPTGGSPVVVGQGGQYDPVASTLTWSIPSLAAGATFTADYTLQVPVGIADGTPWLNSASAQAINAASATSQAQVTISSQPVLEILKTGGNSVNAGENLTYTLEYRNTGNTTAQNVVIQDVVPAGLTFVNASNGGTFSAGTVSWSLGSVQAGAGSSVTLTLQAPLGAIDGTVYPNTASASAANAAGATSSTNSVLRSHVELDVQISGAPNSVAAGADVVFLVNYSNSGNENATNTNLIASLPSNTTFVSATSGYTYNASLGEISWNLGTLGAGANGTVQFLVTVVDPLANGTTTSSTANITADNGLADTATDTISVSSAPLLIIGKGSDVATASLGDTVNFTISLENFGNAAATGIVVTDTLPPELEFVSAGAGGQFDSNANQVTWDLGSIAPGVAATELPLRAKIVVSAPTITNVAEVAANMSPTFSVSRGISLNASPPLPEPKPVPSLHGVLLLLLALLMLSTGAAVIHRQRRI